jgi:two-component system response regulator FixJ
MSGIDLMKELRERDVRLPIVVMSAHADVSVTIQAFKLGVLDFLIKPFESHQFVDAVHQALLRDDARRADERRIEHVASRLKKLTKKDWQIIDLLRPGHPNKRIASIVGISERAVEMRRAALLKKTKTSSLAELFELIAQERERRGT